jgi:hypothetical protein
VWGCVKVTASFTPNEVEGKWNSGEEWDKKEHGEGTESRRENK